jgi:hypothetical protein
MIEIMRISTKAKATRMLLYSRRKATMI